MSERPRPPAKTKNYPGNYYDPERTQVTSYAFGEVIRGIRFPENLNGKIVVDICAGASNTVNSLRAHGVRAYAVDMLYSNLGKLKTLLTQSIIDPLYWVEGRTPPPIPAKNQILEDPPYPQGIIGYLKTTWQNYRIQHQYGQPAMIHRRVWRDFRQHLAADNAHIAARAEKLPFKTSSCDFCFSHLGITSFMMGDYEVLRATVREVLRVLKPQGELQMYNWIEGEQFTTPRQRANGEKLLRYLSAHHIPFQVEETVRGFHRLRILKP